MTGKFNPNLPSDLRSHPQLTIPVVQAVNPPHKSLEKNQREYILSVLKCVAGNKTRAAIVIGIDRVALWRKLKKYEQNGRDGV